MVQSMVVRNRGVYTARFNVLKLARFYADLSKSDARREAEKVLQLWRVRGWNAEDRDRLVFEKYWMLTGEGQPARTATFDPYVVDAVLTLIVGAKIWPSYARTCRGQS